MRRKLRPLARRKAPGSSCLGAAPHWAKERRRLPRGIAVLAAVVLLFALAPSASASIQFVDAWGADGSGDGQFHGPQDVATDFSGSVYVADFPVQAPFLP